METTQNKSEWHAGIEGLDWDDGFRLVELVFPDGRTVTGPIYVDAWFDGEDEIPIFSVNDYFEGKDSVSFFDCEKWRFIPRSK